MTGYEMSRAWFDFAFENTSKVSMSHNALMFSLIEVNNRMGWKKEFGITAKECMDLMGCSSYNTYKKTLDDLVDFGFVKLVKKSANQYQCNVIALSKNDESPDNPQYKALDKALTNHLTKRDQSTCDILKPQTINNKPEEEGLHAGEPGAKDPEPSGSSFVPPSHSDVQAYFQELIGFESIYLAKNFSNAFVAYYTESNWYDKNRKKLTDWKMAIALHWVTKDHWQQAIEKARPKGIFSFNKATL